MFERCLTTMRTAKTAPAIVYSIGRPKSTFQPVSDKDATIDEIDTIRVSPTMTNHVPSAHAAGIGVTAKKTPTLVATPLPPWNPSQTGQLCPSTAAAPQMTRKSSALTGIPSR